MSPENATQLKIALEDTAELRRVLARKEVLLLLSRKNLCQLHNIQGKVQMNFGNPFILREATKSRDFDVLDAGGEWTGTAFKALPRDRNGDSILGVEPLFYISFKVPQSKVQVTT